MFGMSKKQVRELINEEFDKRLSSIISPMREQIQTLQGQVATLMRPHLEATIQEYQDLGGGLKFMVVGTAIQQEPHSEFISFTYYLTYTEEQFRKKFIDPLKLAKYEQCREAGECKTTSTIVPDNSTDVYHYVWTNLPRPAGEKNSKQKQKKRGKK